MTGVNKLCFIILSYNKGVVAYRMGIPEGGYTVYDVTPEENCWVTNTSNWVITVEIHNQTWPDVCCYGDSLDFTNENNNLKVCTNIFK